MSVLIKGMEMPKNDSWVNVRIKEKDGKPIIAFITGEDLEGRYFEIEELPTPHGRLIDADKLMQWIEHVYGDKDIIKFITDDIKRQPTIVEADLLKMVEVTE